MNTRAIDYAGATYTVTLAHPAADAMPWHLDRGDFAAMVEDMRAAGFDKTRPVVRHADTGLVINGRRRELAAAVAGVTPLYRDVRWDAEEVVEYVRREDLLRRDLSPSERAAAAVELAELLPEGRPGKTPQRCGVSAAEIADGANVGQRTVEDAVKVKRKAPELLSAVKEGKLPAHTAAKVADLPADKRAEVAAAKDVKAAAKAAVQSAPKGGEKPAKKKPTPAPKDGLGNPVPACVADTFGDGMLADAIARINAAHAELLSIEKHVVSTLNKKSEFWPYVQFGECAKSLAAAADRAAEASAQLSNGLPFCVCPKCNGKGCKDCRNGGYWTRHRHEQRAQYGD